MKLEHMQLIKSKKRPSNQDERPNEITKSPTLRDSNT